MRVDVPKSGERSAEQRGIFQEKEQTMDLHTVFLQVWYEVLDQSFGDVFKRQTSQSSSRPTEPVSLGYIKYVSHRKTVHCLQIASPFRLLSGFKLSLPVAFCSSLGYRL